MIDTERLILRPYEVRDRVGILSQVAGQYRQDQSLKAARAVAQQILNKVNGGMPLGTAVAQSGARLPAPRPVTASRAQLAQLGPQVPPALSLMFSMAPRKLRLTAAPNGEGWLLVYLDGIQRGNAANDKAAITGVGRELGRMTGNEYAEQFVEAVRRQIGVKRDETVINRVRGELVGGAAPASAQ